MEDKIDPVVKEFDKVRKRKRASNATAVEAIDEMARALSRCRTKLTLGASAATTPADDGDGGSGTMDVDTSGPTPAMCADAMKKAIEEINAAHKKIQKAHKETTSTLNKYGKVIDKVFVASTSKITGASLPASEHLDHAIVDHMLRLGRCSLAEQFIAASSAEVAEERLEECRSTHAVLDALGRRDPHAAIAWASEHDTRLAESGSRLGFMLHRLAYIALLTKGDRIGAITYARENFERYATTESLEIRRMLGALVFTNRLQGSPYDEYSRGGIWRETADLFTRETARLAGLPKECPLAVCVDAGCVAVPKLLKVVDLLAAARKDEAVLSGEELPVEVDLGENRLYHSVFCCPVSRETANASNVPMRLPCGHVISRDSIRKIAKGARRRFKCPYCPMEATTNDVQKLQF